MDIKVLITNVSKVLTTVLFFSSSTPAWAGPGKSGGGDIECENTIKSIRNDLIDWIKKDGHKSLRFYGIQDAQTYKKTMSHQLVNAKFSCIGDGHEKYPVQILNVPKICVFESKKTEQFYCDYSKFNLLTIEKKYQQIHHEYAGLAKQESPSVNDLTDSNYQLSNQITDFLEKVTVVKLAVKEAKKLSDQLFDLKFENSFMAPPGGTVSAQNNRETELAYLLRKRKFLDAIELLNTSQGEVQAKSSGVFYPGTIGYNLSPLSIAIINEHKEIIKLLINKGAKFGNGIENTFTIGLALSNNSSLEFIKFLIDQGADINNSQMQDQNVLYQKLSNRTSTLYSAIVNHRPDVFRFLLDNKANTNITIIRYYNDISLLEVAITEGEAEIVKMLLENRFYPETVKAILSDSSIKPENLSNSIVEHKAEMLNRAIQIQNPRIQKILLDYGVWGWGNLAKAALYNNLFVMKKLIELGADVNSAQIYGNKNGLYNRNLADLRETPFFKAIEGDSVEAMKLLIEKDANPKKTLKELPSGAMFYSGFRENLKTDEDLNNAILFHATENLSLKVFDLLQKKGFINKVTNNSSYKSSLISIALAVDCNICKHLSERSEDADAFYYNEQAFRIKKMHFIQRLLDLGEDIDKDLLNKGTPLNYAIITGQKEIVKFLIEHGANANLISKRAQQELRAFEF